MPPGGEGQRSSRNREIDEKICEGPGCPLTNVMESTTTRSSPPPSNQPPYASSLLLLLNTILNFAPLTSPLLSLMVARRSKVTPPISQQMKWKTALVF